MAVGEYVMNVSMLGRCGDCFHVWTVAYLPMPPDKLAKLLCRAACPACAGTDVSVGYPPKPRPETPPAIPRNHERHHG
jgi:hypothetical protein